MRSVALWLALLCSLAAGQEQGGEAPRLKVLASIPTYGNLAEQIGGELVEVVTVCRPGQDLHAVTGTPSILARARDADLLLYTGYDAEAWLWDLMRGSGNGRLLPGQPGTIPLGAGMTLRNVPTFVSRDQGDVHAFGNPHLWTDPLNVRTMAVRVRDALIEALPDHAEALRARHAAFHRRLTVKLVEWLTAAKPHAGQQVVVYHWSWIYLLDRLGLVRAGAIEPKPRVTPTVADLERLVAMMREEHIRVVIREPYQHPRGSEYVCERTEATELLLSTHPGFPEGTEDVIDHFDHVIGSILGALDDQPDDAEPPAEDGDR